MPASKTVYLGIKGTVLALDAATGQQQWGTHLKGSDFVYVVLDGDNIYATTQGEIFCLDSKTGEARWQNELKGMGYGLASVATENASNAMLMLFAEQRRRTEEESARQANSSNMPSTQS